MNGLAVVAEPNGVVPVEAAKGFPPEPKEVEGVPSPVPPYVPVGLAETPKGDAAKLDTPGDEP